MALSDELPLGVFDNHAAVIGMSGSGKSFFARGIVEHWLERGLRVCIIDPTDVWWGLRSDAAGTGAGFPVVVFGGDHADVPIGERSGARVAEIVASRNLPAIVATAEMTGGERHRFMAEFLDELYRRNKAALHLVLDEADELAPQNPLPETKRTLGAIDRIVRRGRVRGFRVLMITQRPAVLHNNVLAMARGVAVLQLTLPHDRDAFERWIKGQGDPEQGREVLASLPVLAQGEGWIWAPAEGVLLRRQFPLIKTFDSMRTPEHGEVIAEPTRLAPVEIADLRALLAGDAGATPPAKPSAPGAGVAGLAGDVIPPHRSEELDRLRHQNGELHDALRAAEKECDRWKGLVLTIAAALEPVLGRVDINVGAEDPRREATGPEQHAAAAITEKMPHALPDGSAFRSGALKLLAVLATGMCLTWSQVATLAGLKARGGHFNAARKVLRDYGFIVEDGKAVRATAAGIKAVGGVRPKPASLEELVSHWRSILPPTAGRLLDQLYRQAPKWIGRERLAEFLRLAPRGGHWNAALSVLRQNELIEVKGDQLRLNPKLGADL